MKNLKEAQIDNQLLGITKVNQDGDNILKVLNCQTECMMIYNHLFEQAQCKLLNIIESTSGQIYEIVGDEILINIISKQVDKKTQSKIFDSLLDIVTNHMQMTSKQNKPFS